MRTCVAWLRSAGLETRFTSKNSVGERSALRRVSCNGTGTSSIPDKSAGEDRRTDPEGLDGVGDTEDGLHSELCRMMKFGGARFECECAGCTVYAGRRKESGRAQARLRKSAGGGTRYTLHAGACAAAFVRVMSGDARLSTSATAAIVPRLPRPHPPSAQSAQPSFKGTAHRRPQLGREIYFGHTLP